MKRVLIILIITFSFFCFAYEFNLEEFNHDIHSRDYFNPVKNNEIYLSVSVPRNSVKEVYIYLNGEKYEMNFLRNSGKESFFRIKLYPENYSKYFFETIIENQEYFLGKNKGITKKEINEFIIDYQNLPVQHFDLPEWTKGIVYYQIFVERFNNGDKTNDPENVQDWKYKETSNLGSKGFFGGDLKGVIDKIDYLKDLGINAIYFNPIFESVTSHKYDTKDYLKIDGNFGDMYLFEKLMTISKDNNIKIILDGVFNHSGDEFWAFEDIKKYNEDSEYIDWFFVKNFPVEDREGKAVNYIGWNGFSHMPKFNLENDSVKEYIKSIINFYDNMGINGWRLDVANEVFREFWIECFRPEVKTLNEESLIVGEIWGDAKTYLMGEMFDSVMNYPFREALLNYLTKPVHSAKIFANLTELFLNSYPPQVLDSLWNIVDSHDTARILSSVYGDLNLMKLAVVIQMTFKGSPVIYYGTEIGLDGLKDPFCRKPMIWDEDEQNLDLYNFYKALISLREEYEPIKYGDIKFLNKEGKILVYSRFIDDQEIVIAINPSDNNERVNLDIEGKYEEYFSKEKYSLQEDSFLDIYSKDFLILIKKDLE